MIYIATDITVNMKMKFIILPKVNQSFLFFLFLHTIQFTNIHPPTNSSIIYIVPSKPQNVRVLDITSTTIKISWHEPERPNGVIHAYRVYYVFLNQTLLHLPMLKNDASVGSPFHYTLINLSKYFSLNPSFFVCVSCHQ